MKQEDNLIKKSIDMDNDDYFSDEENEEEIKDSLGIYIYIYNYIVYKLYLDSILKDEEDEEEKKD